MKRKLLIIGCSVTLLLSAFSFPFSAFSQQLVEGKTPAGASGANTKPVEVGGLNAGNVVPLALNSDGTLSLTLGSITFASPQHVIVDSASSVAVTGTFWQATQPVSGTFWQSTQPVSIAAAPLMPNDGGGHTMPVGDASARTIHETIDNSSVAVTGTFWQTTQPVSGTFWQATQPVSGTFWQATQPVSVADGSSTTLGAKADAKSTATDTTAVSEMSVLKEISAMAQAPAAVSTGTNVIGKVGIDQTTPGTTNGVQVNALPVNYTTALTTLQNAAAATGNGSTINTTGLSAVMIYTSGTFSATISFEVSVDGTNFVSVVAGGVGTGSASGNTTASGTAFRVPVSGTQLFRARISSYTSGNVTVVGLGIADGAAQTPVVTLGSTSTWSDTITSALNIFTQSGTNTQGVDAIGYGAINTTTAQMLRTPNKFITFTISASSSETTIWTPTSGKKFRFMGFSLFSDTATVLTFKDNTAGTTIWKDGVGANSRAVNPPMGNGILSAAANNLLTLTCGTAATVNGVAFGTEE